MMLTLDFLKHLRLFNQGQNRGRILFFVTAFCPSVRVYRKRGQNVGAESPTRSFQKRQV